MAWWKEQVRRALIDNGIAATWNDNNEFEIWDRYARATVSAPRRRPARSGRPGHADGAGVAGGADRSRAPEARPHVVSRAGCPGLQRYAQTWTGDNATSWKTLKYNTRMGLGLNLSGLFGVGHDVGGFAGPPPDAELLVRWVQNGHVPSALHHAFLERGRLGDVALDA